MFFVYAQFSALICPGERQIQPDDMLQGEAGRLDSPENGLDDIRCEEGQADQLAYIALRAALLLGEIGHRSHLFLLKRLPCAPQKLDPP